MIPFLFQHRPHGVLYAALGGACLFVLLARKAYRGAALIPLSQTILLSVTTLGWVYTEWVQAKVWHSEYYRANQLHSFLSFGLGSILLGSVWALWLLGRRAPTANRNYLFAWTLTVYLWTVWGTSAAVLGGS